MLFNTYPIDSFSCMPWILSGYVYNNSFGDLSLITILLLCVFFVFFFYFNLYFCIIDLFLFSIIVITSQTVVVNSALVIHIVTDNVNFVNRLRRLILYNNNSIMRSFCIF